MELERLHVLQDKPFPEAKKVIMVNELGTGVFPFSAVIQGIKSLHGEDIKSLKLFIIIEAIRTFFDSNVNRFECGSCRKSGCVIMIDAVGDQFALACTCSNGDIVVNIQGLVRWNGKGVQESNGRILFRAKEDRVAHVNRSAEVSDQELKDLVDSVGGTVVDQGERK